MNRLPEDASNGSLNTPSPELDLLLSQLYACEEQLQGWIKLSDRNALLFAKDLVAALREANLGIDDAALQQLQSILATVARKTM